MATHIPEGTSVKVAVGVVDAIHAAVSSDPETVSLAPTWQGLRDRGDTEAKKRNDADRALLRARSQLGVYDAKWDATVASFGRAVVDASGGRRDQPPCTRLFGKITPSGAQKFGKEREIMTGRGWLVELGREPGEPLAQTWTPKLKAATDELEMAFNHRNDCLRALEPLQTSVVLFIDDVNRELDRLEGDLKKLFPGAPERVASYLAASRPSPSSNDDLPPASPPVAE